MTKKLNYLHSAFAKRIRKKEVVVLSILFILFVIRLSLINLMGLMPQDAYYSFYSEHLDLSYYDHPGGIAWLIWVFTFLLGKKVFVVKLAATIVTLFTQVAFILLATCFLDFKGVIKATIFLLSSIMISVLSLVATPDVPLLLFWTLSIIALYIAVFRNKRGFWLLAGILMGLAFNSKYTAIFLPAGLIIFLILSPLYRKFLLSYWFYACLLLFIITAMPVIIWNYEHGFASLKFQSVNRMTEAQSSFIGIKGFLGVIGHQAFLLVPILFFSLITLLWTLYKKYGFKSSAIPAQQLFLFSFFAPVFIGFLFISFFYWVKINWMMPAYITGIILACMYVKESWVRYQLICSLVIHLAFAVEIIFYPVAVKSDDTWVGWDELAQHVKIIKKSHPGYFIFSADDYKTAAVLNFYFEEMVYSKNIIGERALQFDYVNTDLQTIKGRNAIFIDSHPDLSPCGTYPPVLDRYFTHITPLQPILVKKGGRVIRIFCVYACANYDPSGRKNLFQNALPSGMLKYISGAFKNDYQAEFNVKLQYRDVIWVGASYRQFDGYAAMLGFNVANTFNVGYSFDYTKTDLQTFTKGTHASIKRVRGTRAYLHQVATEQPTSATLWTNEASPNPEFTFSGLISGKTYWLRVAILSSTGKTVYSSVKSCIVQ